MALVDPAVLSGHPQFARMLDTLAPHLAPTGATLPVQQDLDKALASMARTKQTFLQAQILFDTLQTALEDASSLAPGSNGQRVIYDQADRALALALAQQHLDFNPLSADSASMTLYDLKPKDLMHVAATAGLADVSTMQHVLIPDIEARLRQKGESILRFYDSKDESGSGRRRKPYILHSHSHIMTATLAQAKALQLGELLAADQERVVQLERDIEALTVQSIVQFEEYFQVSYLCI